jgi:hypothetical protein
MEKLRIKPIYLAGLMLFSVSCTDLEVEELDSRLIENEAGEFSGVDPEAMVTTGYNNLRAFADQANTYALHEVTSDELLVPTRGTDWGDNGVWRSLHQHTWDATHQQILTSWEQLNSNVFRMNQLLHPATTGKTAQQIAEGRFLRAYNMYLILDLFGQVPFRDADEGIEVDPSVMQPEEAFNFILADLNAALPDLTDAGPGEATLRATNAAAHFLMAKLHINKHVFLGAAAASNADMDVVIESVNAIQAAGFALYEGDYFDIFEQDLESETIFWTDASWGNRIWNTLHYHQNTPNNAGGGWNGFSTTAEFYALFEGNPDNNEPGNNQEERRGFVPTDGSHLAIGYGFLVGQQYDEAGQPLNDRAGRPLVYTKEFPALVGNTERNGIRVIKYHPENGEFTNHYILFRYADAHLMKAEALARQGNMGEALVLVNELREIRDASPLASLDMSDLLDERGRELYIEGWRRNDQIRFGTYTDAWTLKPASEDFRRLFPIPANAVASNPNLEQNPGY